ncbi:hypothetical protein EZV62_024063 [Acer yangbiense]|uniref:Uncharacterized protein n=1 Tax=Acer yangbiense TaxID=1000413 RepID=A0A5C7H493_9ROSI|nr:hypothetical protein EZV62_024063 [Acer yangbiense]
MDMKFQALPQHESLTLANPNANPDPSPQSTAEAPPKQVAVALEFGQCKDWGFRVSLFWEQTDSAKQVGSSQTFVLHFHDVRSIGRQSEETGVLNEPLRLQSNYWGLHMPLVCPDGAVVAYAWKRQLAGQAGASAVDRTSLKVEASSYLDDGLDGVTTEPVSNKQCVSQLLPASKQEELSDCKTLTDVLMRLEKEVPNLKIFTYERLDWLKRASSLPNKVSVDKIAVIELFFPSVFRAVFSLHPVGSIDPDAVAFFPPDEVLVVTALQCFLGISVATFMIQVQGCL